MMDEGSKDSKVKQMFSWLPCDEGDVLSVPPIDRQLCCAAFIERPAN
jgi:hypothetical protein